MTTTQLAAPSGPALGGAVAAEVRAEMARQMITVSKMAEQLHVSDMWVSRRVRGRVGISLDDLEAIADVLGVQWWRLVPRTKLPRLDSNQQPAGNVHQPRPMPRPLLRLVAA